MPGSQAGEDRGGSSPFFVADRGPKLSEAILKAAKAKMEAEDFGAQECLTPPGVNDHS